MISFAAFFRDVAKKKQRENVGIFPKWGTPPLFGNDMFFLKKIMVYFAF